MSAQEFSVDVSCFDIIVMLSRPFRSIDELAEVLWCAGDELA
jgi:hypothetical protein